MKKILFICHGNICRSPMAEFVMKDLVAQSGLTDQFYIESAATSTEELGNSVHYGTRNKLAEHGISCAGKQARQITTADYSNFDLLICMDQANICNAKRIWHSDTENKIRLLLNNPAQEVADPWYTGNFEDTWQDVYTGCKALLAQLSSI